MNRCGCSEEDTQQSTHSPGIVLDEEAIVFALILGPDGDVASIEIFSKSKLKDRNLSVCRGGHSTFDEMHTRVVEPQLDPSTQLGFRGFYWATCSEIRSIVAERNTSRPKGLVPTAVGAFCVIDEGEPDHPAHARIGYCNPLPNFWSLHQSVAARGNLLLKFAARGVFLTSSVPPFMGPPAVS
jgi:hypothetical protein